MLSIWKRRKATAKKQNSNNNSTTEPIATEFMKDPISPGEAREMLAKIKAARDGGNADVCRESVVKLRTIIGQSKRNKRCVVSNGGVEVLLATFRSFSEKSDKIKQQRTTKEDKDYPFVDYNSVLDEILSTVATKLLPLDEESRSSKHWTDSSLNCIIQFMNSSELRRQSNAVMVLREILLTADQTKCDRLIARSPHSLNALAEIVKHQTCPASATKAGLLSIHYLISKSSEPSKTAAAARLSNLGVGAALVERLVDCDKSVCEKSLAVLDGICCSGEGRAAAAGYALTVPVLVKKLHRVSELSTELSVSVLWKLAKYDEGVVVEAIRVGSFQKLLLLLQVGCGESTKEKAGELLKMMNVHKNRGECM